METINRKNEDGKKNIYQPELLTSLAAKYNVTLVTFRKWIKPIEHKLSIKHKVPLTPTDMKIIIEFLGEY